MTSLKTIYLITKGTKLRCIISVIARRIKFFPQQQKITESTVKSIKQRYNKIFCNLVTNKQNEKGYIASQQ